MSNIQKVNYEIISSRAKQMRTYGKDINTELTKIYQNIDQMREYWYGTRYDELVAEFKALIPSLNEFLKSVVNDIPSTLETVANNYSQFDKGTNITSVLAEEPTLITDIDLSNKEELKFLTNEVTTIQNDVSKSFQEILELINKISDEYTKMDWVSQASENFRDVLSNIRTKRDSEFTQINTQFTKLMEVAKEEMQSVEDTIISSQ